VFYKYVLFDKLNSQTSDHFNYINLNDFIIIMFIQIKFFHTIIILQESGDADSFSAFQSTNTGCDTNNPSHNQ